MGHYGSEMEDVEGPAYRPSIGQVASGVKVQHEQNRTKGNIANLVMEAQDRSNTLHEEISMLIERTNTILTPEQDVAEPALGGGSEPNYSSELASQLVQLNMSLKQAINRLSSLRQGVDL